MRTVASQVYRITSSMADAYDACPRSAALAAPFASTPETERGQRQHRALYHTLARRMAQRPSDDDDVVRAAGIRADSDEADDARAMLDWVRAHLHDGGLEVLAAECPLQTCPRPVLGAEGLRVQLAGRADIVARQGRTLHVLDLKTGRRAAAEDQLTARPSSAVYTLLARSQWPDPDRIVVSHLYSATRRAISAELSEAQVEAGRATVRYIVGLLAEGSAAQVAVPGEHCAWCAARQECPAWPAPIPDGADGEGTF